MSGPSDIVSCLLDVVEAEGEALRDNAESFVNAKVPALRRATLVVGAGLGLVFVASILLLGALGFLLAAVYLFALQESISPVGAAVLTGLITFLAAAGSVAFALWIQRSLARSGDDNGSSTADASTEPAASAQADARLVAAKQRFTHVFQNEMTELAEESTWTAVLLAFVSGLAAGSGESSGSGAAWDLGGSLGAALGAAAAGNSDQTQQ